MSSFTRHMALAAISLAGIAGVVRADAILQFGPVPNDNTPEFQFNTRSGDTAPSFYAASGALSSGDGNLPTALQVPGGLQLTTAFLPTYSALRGQDLADAHLFYDASLTLTGFTANAPAVDAVVSLVQSLGAGDFEIRATNGELLLSGHANSATITGIDTTGSTFSANVVYNGGSFLSYLPGTTGGFSFTDLQITPTLSLGQNYISDFTANGTGDFRVDASFVPVPAAAWSGMGLIALLGGMQFLRRRAIAD